MDFQAPNPGPPISLPQQTPLQVTRRSHAGRAGGRCISTSTMRRIRVPPPSAPSASSGRCLSSHLGKPTTAVWSPSSHLQLQKVPGCNLGVGSARKPAVRETGPRFHITSSFRERPGAPLRSLKNTSRPSWQVSTPRPLPGDRILRDLNLRSLPIGRTVRKRFAVFLAPPRRIQAEGPAN